MAISRRLEGLRSSRLDHSMQNFKAVLFRRVPRPDSLDLAGKIAKSQCVFRVHTCGVDCGAAGGFLGFGINMYVCVTIGFFMILLKM